MGRVDYNLTGKQRLYGRYFYTRLQRDAGGRKREPADLDARVRLADSERIV